MKHKTSPILLVMLVLGIIVQGALQRAVIFNQWVRDFNPGKGKVYTNAMSPDQILAVPGVHHVETSIAVKTVKYNARIAKITSAAEAASLDDAE